MENKDNYIYIPLVGIFISILRLLFISEAPNDSNEGEVVAYILLFTLSAIDVYRNTSADEDDWFSPQENTSNNGYYGDNGRYNYNDNTRYNYGNRSNSKTNSDNVKTNIIDKTDIKKIRNKLIKTKDVTINNLKNE